MGSVVATHMATNHGDAVAALHLTDLPAIRVPEAVRERLTESEQMYYRGARRWRSAEGGYLGRAGDQALHPGACSRGLACRSGGVDHRETTRVVRPQRRCRISLHTRRSPDIGEPVLAHRGDRYLIRPLFGYAARCSVHRDSHCGQHVQPWPAAARAVTVRQVLRCAVLGNFMTRGGHFAAWEKPAEYVRGLHAAVGLVSPHS